MPKETVTTPLKEYCDKITEERQNKLAEELNMPVDKLFPQTTSVPLFDRHGHRAGEVEIPVDVMQSAGRVYDWISGQPNPLHVKLNGICLWQERSDD